MELPEVFDATHQLLLELVGSGRGHRPADRSPRRPLFAAGIFREAAATLRGGVCRCHLPPDGRAIYLMVEKILTGERTVAERLAGPRHDRLRFRERRGGAAGRLLSRSAPSPTRSSDSSVTRCISAISFTRRSDWSCGCRSPTTSTFSGTWSTGFRSRIAGFAITRSRRWPARCARRSPVSRFIELISRPGQPVSEEDRAVIERAVAAAKRRNPAHRRIGLQFPARHFALSFSGKPRRRSARGRTAHFVLKFQQTPGRSWRRDWRTRSFTFTTGWRR